MIQWSYMSKHTTPRKNLPLPAKVHEQVKKAAKKSGRTMVAEVDARFKRV